jgi:hypothetical protein
VHVVPIVEARRSAEDALNPFDRLLGPVVRRKGQSRSRKRRVASPERAKAERERWAEARARDLRGRV